MKNKARSTENAACNVCGKKIEIIGNDIETLLGAARVSAEWLYGSEYDGETHSWIMCESCFARMKKNFFQQPDRKQRTEYL